MKYFTLNTYRHPVPADVSTFGRLLQHVHDELSPEGAMIGSIEVNGLEISTEQQLELDAVALTKLESIEIDLASSREVADDTLQMLVPFSASLADTSRKLVKVEDADGTELRRLIDGLQTFHESITCVKKILGVAHRGELAMLEAEFVSILSDLAETLENGDATYESDLLGEHLPNHLRDWREAGIPRLMARGDS